MIQLRRVSLIQQAARALGNGENLQAARLSAAALRVAKDDGERSEARQWGGIASRLGNKFYKAEEAFNKALLLEPAGTIRSWTLMRDLGMVSLDCAMALRRLGQTQDEKMIEELIATALELFTKSHVGLQECSEDGANLEMWVSNGFVGRALAVKGEREAAMDRLLKTDQELQKGPNRGYELNNLMWVLWTSRSRNQLRLRRAYELIKVTGDTRRLAQYHALAGGNRDYENVR